MAYEWIEQARAAMSVNIDEAIRLAFGEMERDAIDFMTPADLEAWAQREQDAGCGLRADILRQVAK